MLQFSQGNGVSSQSQIQKLESALLGNILEICDK